MSNVPNELQELAGLIGAMLGGKVDVEVIEVPKGSNLKEVLAQREDPNWCDACQEVHEDEPIESKQAKAIIAIDGRIGRLHTIIEKLRELQSSIGSPTDQRTSAQTLKEVFLAHEIERLMRKA